MKCLNSSWGSASLAKNTLYIAKRLNELNYINDNVKLLIERYGRTNEEGLLSINNIQSMIHSVDFNPEKSIVNRYWDDLEPFLAGCWELIKYSDSQK